jgi:hypothetical protein
MTLPSVVSSKERIIVVNGVAATSRLKLTSKIPGIAKVSLTVVMAVITSFSGTRDSFSEQNFSFVRL